MNEQVFLSSWLYCKPTYACASHDSYCCCRGGLQWCCVAYMYTTMRKVYAKSPYRTGNKLLLFGDGSIGYYSSCTLLDLARERIRY